MLEIPEGGIDLRDDRINRIWTVKIKPFLISQFQVTQKLYFNITGKSPSFFKGAYLPVEGISWLEAVDFCNLLSEREGLSPYYIKDKQGEKLMIETGSNAYRLPLESEWEYVCKAGTTGIRYGEIEEIAWYQKNSKGKPHDVGTKKPNNWGAYDMLGNVWEWCSDIYDESEYGSYRIIRGGGWNDEARGCLATNRRRSHPTSFKIDDLGFRIARNND